MESQEFKDSVYLVIEIDLENRFPNFEKLVHRDKYVLNLRNILNLSPLKGIISRFKYRNTLFKEIQKLDKVLAGKRRVFITNCEGFIAINVLDYIRTNYPDIKIIVLQHGMFLYDPIAPHKIVIRQLINILCKIFFKMKLFGFGFGKKVADQYMVYNNDCKKYLVSQGWEDADILVSSFYLTGFNNSRLRVKKNFKEQRNTALFLLQPLSKVAVTTEELQYKLVSDVITKLSNDNEHLIIKHHPYSKIKLPALPANTSIIDSMDDINSDQLSIVASFFSTALFDFEYLGIPTVSIHSKDMVTNHKVYEMFRYLYYFDTSKNSEKFEIKLNPFRKDLPIYYEEGISTIEELDKATSGTTY